jgi:hypothetical protein
MPDTAPDLTASLRLPPSPCRGVHALKHRRVTRAANAKIKKGVAIVMANALPDHEQVDLIHGYRLLDCLSANMVVLGSSWPSHFATVTSGVTPNALVANVARQSFIMKFLILAVALVLANYLDRCVLYASASCRNVTRSASIFSLPPT